MKMNMNMKIKSNVVPLFIIITGIIFSLLLFFLISDEIHYSADAGLKSLLAKQLASGILRFDLKLPAEPWIEQLWRQGLYPFEPPFVYQQRDVYFISFPFPFILINAPFYAVFGWRGFFVIPLVSTWVFWGGFYWVCQHLKLGNLLTCFALATLIFASPVSMYSAMYWEHTLALCLAFNGLAIAFIKGTQGWSKRDAILSGSLIGLSVWFRPEYLALVGILFGLVAASYLLDLGYLNLISKRHWVFLGSMVFAVLCFFAVNQLVYSHPLGIHSLQVVEGFSPRTKLYQASKIIPAMQADLFQYFPVLYFASIYIGLSIFTDKIQLTPALRKFVLISLAFTYAVPLVVPSEGGREWGPRFLLFAIPLSCLAATLALGSTWKVKRFGLKYLSLAFVAICFVWGVHVNAYSGILAFSESGFLPVLNLVRESPNKLVAFPHQYVGQSLTAVVGDKFFFLTKDREDLIKFAQSLPIQGYDSFMYICPIYHACFESGDPPETLEFNVKGRQFQMEFSEIKKMERYLFYEGSISESLVNTDRAAEPSNPTVQVR